MPGFVGANLIWWNRAVGGSAISGIPETQEMLDFCAAEGIDPEVEFIRMDFPAMVPALRDGRFDGIDTGMFLTEERTKLMFMVPHAQQALSVFVPDRRGGVWFEHREGYLGTQGNRTLLAHAVNVPSVKVTLWQMYANNLVAWRTSERSRAVESLGRQIASKTITLNAARNRVDDVQIALDELLGERQLGDGVYQVTLEANEPRMSEIEGNGKPDHAVGIEPFLR